MLRIPCLSRLGSYDRNSGEVGNVEKGGKDTDLRRKKVVR